MLNWGVRRTIDMLQDGTFYEKFKRAGWVRVSTRGPLVILNYTHKTQHKAHWFGDEGKVTRVCRGLIIDERDWSVAALPLQKFFNVGEHTKDSKHGPLPINTPFSVYEKVDGWLGILYRMEMEGNTDLAIASRGSFDSPGAQEATQLLGRYDVEPWVRENHLTPLFEIISPATKIIVNYDTYELVLLAVMDRTTGRELARRRVVELAKEMGCRVAEQKYVTDLDDLAAITSQLKATEAEGYVIHYEDGLRVKLKSGDYTQVARALRRYTQKSVIEMLENGYTREDVYAILPRITHEQLDKDIPWILNKADDLRSTAQNLYEAGIEHVKELGIDPYEQHEMKKAYALYVNSTPDNLRSYRSMAFAIFDGKKPDYYKVLRSFASNYHPFEDEKEQAGELG